MRQHLELVDGMEAHQGATRPAAIEQCSQPAIGEHPLDEIVAQARVVQPPLLPTGRLGNAVMSASANSPRPVRAAVARSPAAVPGG